MKALELRKKNEKDLKKLLMDTRKELRDFRFGVSGGKIKDVKKGRDLRKEIAKIMTVLEEKNKNGTE